MVRVNRISSCSGANSKERWQTVSLNFSELGLMLSDILRVWLAQPVKLTSTKTEANRTTRLIKLDSYLGNDGTPFARFTFNE